MRKEYDFSKGKRGAVVSNAGKQRVTMWLDKAVLDTFRKQAEATGTGYQTLINEALVATVKRGDSPATRSDVRRIVREELKQRLHA